MGWGETVTSILFEFCFFLFCRLSVPSLGQPNCLNRTAIPGEMSLGVNGKVPLATAPFNLDLGLDVKQTYWVGGDCHHNFIRNSFFFFLSTVRVKPGLP